MSMLPFWNKASGMEKLDGIPVSFGNWVAGDPENLDDPNILELLNLTEGLLLHIRQINLASHFVSKHQ
jgi:hypothetical protein